MPGAGYYYDYLNQNHIANSWQFSTSKYSLLSALAKSGLARTKAPECPGLSNSGTISTPYFFDVLGVQMNLWYVGYANPKEMYEKGYDCINTNDGDLYIVS